MADVNKEAVEFWNSLKPMIDEEIKTRTRGMVQRRKMKVTTAPSLNTNKIGVTEPFGTEMLIPFTTNLISATVGDVVWVEFMYGLTNAFASMFASADEKDWDVAGDLSVVGDAGIGGNLGVSGSTSLQNTTVNGVLDITPRRCYATLSSAGWYRAMNVNVGSANASKFSVATIVDINIGTEFWANTNGTHKISLQGVFNNPAFVGEESRSNYMLVDKVRYTYDSSGNGHIDIHYIGTSGNPVWCTFAVHMPYTYQHWFVAENLTSVADSPSGETVLAEYTFVANNTGEKIEFTPTSGASYENYGGCWYARTGNIVQVHVGISGLTANTTTTIFTLPVAFRPKVTAISTGKAGTNLTYAQLQIGYASGSVQVISTGTYAMCDVIYIV